MNFSCLFYRKWHNSIKIYFYLTSVTRFYLLFFKSCILKTEKFPWVKFWFVVWKRLYFWFLATFALDFEIHFSTCYSKSGTIFWDLIPYIVTASFLSMFFRSIIRDMLWDIMSVAALVCLSTPPSVSRPPVCLSVYHYVYSSVNMFI